MLKISNVRYRYRSGFWLKPADALKGVSFEVPRGSIFGFLGANGAGKTTLIQLITGLRQPSSGQIEVMGLPAGSLEARSRIGYLPERPYFYDHLTGDGLLQYFGKLSGMSSNEIAVRSEKVLATVGMTHARGKLLRSYSKGMLQRIGIAQAILHGPDLLILDEPMSGLDPIGRREIRELIRTLAREGKTIFFSSHVIPDVETICDHAALISHGKLVKHGALSEFFKDDQVGYELLVDSGPAEKLNGIAGVSDVQIQGSGQIRLTIPEQQHVNAIVETAMSRGFRLREFGPKRVSLEDFFE